MEETYKALKSYLQTLQTERQQWENLWQEVQDYLRPGAMPIQYEGIPGDRRDSEIYHSAPIKFSDRLRAALSSLLTNRTSKWVGIGTYDETINSDDASQDWFDDVIDVLMAVFENSNFYDETDKMYSDAIDLGTGALFTDVSKIEGRKLKFNCVPLRELYISENSEGVVDTVFRACRMTARQVIEEFGKENVSEKVSETYEKNPEEAIDIIHCVFPRTMRDVTKIDSINKLYASLWFEKDNETILRTGGYDSFPYAVPRWSKRAGEVYGRGPGIIGLGDIKSLNKMRFNFIKSANYKANPVVIIPDDGTTEMDELQPGICIRYDATLGGKPEILDIGGDIPITMDVMQECLDNIAEIFYVTQLNLLDKREMTAVEVEVRQQQNRVVLGPTFGLFNNEFLAIMIERVLDLIAGMIKEDGSTLLPVAPQVIQGKRLKLKFINPLAKAQRLHEVEGVSKVIGTAMNWSQVKPEVVDNIDFDTSIRILQDVSGSPSSMMYPKDDVKKMRAARAQAQAEQAQKEQQLIQAQTLKEGGAGIKHIAKAGVEIAQNQ
jgi:hypothetical protein